MAKSVSRKVKEIRNSLSSENYKDLLLKSTAELGGLKNKMNFARCYLELMKANNIVDEDGKVKRFCGSLETMYKLSKHQGMGSCKNDSSSTSSVYIKGGYPIIHKR